MVNKKDIVYIVVLYNPDEEVKKNIDRLRKITNNIVLVDNSSQDNSEVFKDYLYYPLMDNLGIGKAINVGIEQTIEEYIITLDQDSLIEGEMVNKFINFLNQHDDESIGALTPRYQTTRNIIKETDVEFENVVLSMQSGTLFKRSVLNKTGLMNEDLFIDVVDYEYFLRMEKAGYKLVRVNNAILKHNPAVTKSTKFGPFELKYGIDSSLRYYYQARNLLWVARKYKSTRIYRYFLIKLFKIILLFDDKKKYFKAFNQGVRDANHGKLGRFDG